MFRHRRQAIALSLRAVVASAAPRDWVHPMLAVRHPPHRLDLDLGAWARMLSRLFRRDAAAARARLEHAWAPAGDGLAFLSVRSAFDATLTALAWPAGSEVLVSAINIADMATLLAAHGLVAVPLPLDSATLLPTVEGLAEAVTPRTRGVVLAHLFGARGALDALAAAAGAAGLFVMEDAAQAFAGPAWRGSAAADVTYFSFGTIKTCTALGGALVRVRDADLRDRMRAIEAGWPAQTGVAYARKVVRALALLALQRAPVYSAFALGCRLGRADPAAVVRRMTRGFGGLSAAALLAALRRRPCAALLHVLADRLARFTHTRTEARAAWGRAVAAVAEVPGAAHPEHGHWLIPVLVDDAPAARAALAAACVDAEGPSNMVAIDEARAAALLARLVFVPAYPELPPRVRARALQIVSRRAAPETGPPC